MSAAPGAPDLELEIERVLWRMEGIVRGARAGSISFAASESDPPEVADLVALVAGAEVPAPGAAAPDRWAGAHAEFEAFLGRLADDLRQISAARTSGGACGIQTWVGLAGDTRTILGRAVNEELLDTHCQQIAGAVRARTMRLRMMAATASAAARLVALGAVPGGAVLALPVAFRYMRAMSAAWGDPGAAPSR